MTKKQWPRSKRRRLFSSSNRWGRWFRPIISKLWNKLKTLWQSRHRVQKLRSYHVVGLTWCLFCSYQGKYVVGNSTGSLQKTPTLSTTRPTGRSYWQPQVKVGFTWVLEKAWKSWNFIFSPGKKTAGPEKSWKCPASNNRVFRIYVLRNVCRP